MSATIIDDTLKTFQKDKIQPYLTIKNTRSKPIPINQHCKKCDVLYLTLKKKLDLIGSEDKNLLSLAKSLIKNNCNDKKDCKKWIHQWDFEDELYNSDS